jgi:PAS domain S-box-containing protein
MNVEVRDWAPTVLESMPDAVIATDAAARIFFLNRAAEDLTGWSRQEAVGRHIAEVYLLVDKHDCRPQGNAARSARLLDNTGSTTRVATLESKTGQRFSIESNSSPLTDHDGETLGRVITFRAVTRRKHADDALGAAAELLESITRHMAAAVTRCGKDRRYHWANRCYADWLGLSPDDVIGRPIIDVVGPEGYNAIAPHIERVLAGHRTEYETQVNFKGIGSRWIHAIYEPTFDASGVADGWVAAVNDITLRKGLEESLARLNEQLSQRVEELQALYEAAPVGINVAEDTECRVISGNRALAEILGMPVGQNVSKSQIDSARATYKVLKDGHEVPVQDLPMQRAARGASVQNDPLEIVRGDGSRVPVLVNARPVQDAQGRIKGAVGVCIDVTEIREIERALRNADRRKNEFLAVLAHELRNPLSSISHAVQLLKLEEAPEHAGWAMAVLDRQVKVFARLVDDLLDVARLTSGKIELRKETIDAARVIHQAAEAVTPLIEERKHRMTISLPATALIVDADPVRLEQMVTNLLANAAKYTPDSGMVAVAAADEGGDVTITVRDDGLGIDPAKLPRMFELFAQGEQSALHSGGLGIGLSLVKSLAELHGGSVTASSDGPGHGSSFTIRLPSVAQARVRDTVGADTAPTTEMRRKILIIDDNVDSARSLAKLLQLEGHHAEAIFSAVDAIEKVRAMRPNVLLLDIGLPGITGYEVAARVRQEDGFRDLLIIAVSGYGQAHDRMRSVEAGIDHHLIKPIDFQRLRKLLGE